MPLFGGSKRPPLDGLSKEETARRDSLSPEVLRRSGEGGVAGQNLAALTVLREKSESEPADFLWALLLGWQYMSARRYTPALEALNRAIANDATDVRGYYAAGNASFQAGEAKQSHGSATTGDVAPADMTADNLYQEALRYFRKGEELSSDRTESDGFKSAIGIVEKAVTRKAGRL